jgi:hypothetical protein
MLNTKQKGNLTELQCITSFYELGYSISIPYGENNRYDFIADVNGRLLKIQCKTARLIDDNNSSGAIQFNTISTRVNSQGNIRYKYDKEQIDYFATYWEGKCYLVPVEECGMSCKKIRFVPPKNGQVKGITFAEDYELEKILGGIM